MFGITYVDTYLYASCQDGNVYYNFDPTGGGAWYGAGSPGGRPAYALAHDGNNIYAGGINGSVYRAEHIPPSIAGCEPTSVVQGHTVNIDITGSQTHFKDWVSKATFSGDGVTVNSTHVKDSNHATATVIVAPDAPAGHREVNVITGVETPELLGGVFEVKKAPPQPPHLDSLSPPLGTVGTHVTLSGEHFGDARGQSYVTFNATKANSYHSWADGMVVCNVPSGATSGPVMVTTPVGTSNGVEFMVEKPQVGKITDVSPNAVHQGDTGVDVTITGEYTHFKQGVSVATFSGTGIVVNSTTVTDSTHAVANITVALDAPTDKRYVDVITGAETPAPLADHFMVQPLGAFPPRLDGISPTERAVGDEVTLSGGNFGAERGSSQVTFHAGVAATDYVSWADDKVVCSVPAGATTGPVTVTTPGGTSGGKMFTVGEPVIKDCEPRIVVQGHEVTLDILGEYTHFQQGQSVAVVSGEGVEVGSTYVSDATHASTTLKVADDAEPGTRDVNVITGSESPAPLKNVLTIKKKPAQPPALTALHPPNGPVGTKVSVVGKNFGDARGSSTVTFNGTPVTDYASWSDYDVVCNVPSGTTTGPVTLTTPAGISNGIDFTVTKPHAAKITIESGDYDGDGTSEIAIFRPSSGMWAIRGLTRAYFGGVTDLPASGDYNGDGVTDIAVFRESDTRWAVRGLTRVYFGTTGDIPVPGDYDGDGCCDIVIFDNASGLWRIREITRVYFGGGGDWPAPGDYDGDDTREIAVFRPSSGLWAVRGMTRMYFGGANDWPAAADYHGDGTWEIGIFRPCSGLWALKGLTRAYFGSCTDWPKPADYDGDSTDDIGIFRDTSGLWAIRNLSRVYFGAQSDIPVTR